ncbi:MAG: glutathione S-transferase family protein [Synechococcaceae cyanobacterium SM2_3_2]|nr:glutathione S-transferase family protein [Synechococcaceae cyanobacterium SM2_3_2]
MLRFYDSPASGNCYKVRLLLNQLEIPYERVIINSRAGETRTPEFLAKNPFGQVPLLELDSGETLSESAAILLYLAEGTALAGSNRIERGLVAQWLFVEQFRLFPQLGLTRFWIRSGQSEEYAHEIRVNREAGAKTLEIIDQQLGQSPFLAGKNYTIADIATYAYSRVGDEAGFDLSLYPHLQSWFERMAAQPRYSAPETA